MTEIAALVEQVVTLFLAVWLAHALGISRGETAGRKRGIRAASAFFIDDDNGPPTAADLERILGLDES